MLHFAPYDRFVLFVMLRSRFALLIDRSFLLVDEVSRS